MDLWDNLNKAIETVSKGNDVYLDIKEGNKTTNSTQATEQALQGAITNPNSWKQPAVIVAVIGVAVAVVGLILTRKR